MNPFRRAAEALRRFGHRLAETDEARLADETEEWADSLPGIVLLRECPPRTPVRVAGIVERITVRPEGGLQSLEAVVSDGTGELKAVWLGRASIPGLVLGRRLVLEGVIGVRENERRMVNPRYEFA